MDLLSQMPGSVLMLARVELAPKQSACSGIQMDILQQEISDPIFNNHFC